MFNSPSCSLYIGDDDDDDDDDVVVVVVVDVNTALWRIAQHSFHHLQP